jgi:N6-adenosine-specific RNA methylase IME4
MTDPFAQLEIPEGGFRTIVADPPWKYGKWGTGSGCFNVAIPLPYPSMTVKDISGLAVSNLAASDCDLYLWVTQKYLPESFKVIESWGFKYCQTLTWGKTPRGTGQGGLFCPTTEFLILARKGKMPQGKKRIDTTWWNVKRTKKHSQKPEFFQDIIETVSDSPRLEMFARRPRAGWTVWGNEV